MSNAITRTLVMTDPGGKVTVSLVRHDAAPTGWWPRAFPVYSWRSREAFKQTTNQEAPAVSNWDILWIAEDVLFTEEGIRRLPKREATDG